MALQNKSQNFSPKLVQIIDNMCIGPESSGFSHHQAQILFDWIPLACQMIDNYAGPNPLYFGPIHQLICKLSNYFNNVSYSMEPLHLVSKYRKIAYKRDYRLKYTPSRINYCNDVHVHVT